MSCEECRDYVYKDANFCGNCGAQLREKCRTCMQPLGDEPLGLSEYQDLSRETAGGLTTTGNDTTDMMCLAFLTIAISGEAGELAEKVKKYWRAEFTGLEDPEPYRDAIESELGDILWYMARMADLEGTTLGEVGEENLDKLLDRHERGVIVGSGDDR